MPKSDSFSFFGLLPKELREQIWQFSLEPRLIKLKYDTYSLDITDPPSFLYLLGGYFPYTPFTMEDIERPEEPYRTGHLYPSKVVSPPALAVHRESRDFLIFLGYISWKVENPLWGTRDFMWHPELDVISLPGNETFSSGSHGTPYLHVFMQQFPAQVRVLQKIALSSTCWKLNEAFSMDSSTFLHKFASLTNLVIVLDEEYETHLISWQSSLTEPNQPWTMPDDINELLESVESMVFPSWGMQRTTIEVQLVWTEDAALPYINTERSNEQSSSYHYRNIFPFLRYKNYSRRSL